MGDGWWEGEEGGGWQKLQVTVLDSWVDGEKRRGRGREHLELSSIPHPKKHTEIHTG